MIKKYLMIGLVGLIGWNTAAYAGWPTFQVITPEKIQTLEVSDGCPTGKVRVPIGTQVQIHNRFIPSNEKWFWYYQGDGQCFSKTEGLQYLSLAQNGHNYPSVITTDYGFEGVSLFQFVFHIPSTYPWYCGSFVGTNPPTDIGCAYDEK